MTEKEVVGSFGLVVGDGGDKENISSDCVPFVSFEVLLVVLLLLDNVPMKWTRGWSEAVPRNRDKPTLTLLQEISAVASDKGKQPLLLVGRRRERKCTAASN